MAALYLRFFCILYMVLMYAECFKCFISFLVLKTSCYIGVSITIITRGFLIFPDVKDNWYYAIAEVSNNHDFWRG